MQLLIAAIGRLGKSDPKSILIDDYIDRIQKTGRPMGFSKTRLITPEAPKGLKGLAGQTKESSLLLEAIPKDAYLISLDEKGDHLTSTKFAQMLEKLKDNGTSMTAFAIGGADGHTEDIHHRAQQKIAFGKATWPHMMARLMLCEQLYRAMTIMTGHPYHRE